MAILTRAQEIEGDLNISVGTTDFSITDEAPEYHTNDPEIIDFGNRSTLVDLTVEVEQDPVTDLPPAPADAPADDTHDFAPADSGLDHHEGALS